MSSVKRWSFVIRKRKPDLSPRARPSPGLTKVERLLVVLLVIAVTQFMLGTTATLAQSTNTPTRTPTSTCTPVFPNDTYFEDQWYLHFANDPYWGTPTPGHEYPDPPIDIDAPEAWVRTPRGDGVIVALIGHGVDLGAYEPETPTPIHPDLDGNLWINADETPNNSIDDDGNGYVDEIYGYDFLSDDPHPHEKTQCAGTMTAGVVAAETNNAQGIAGVAWNAKLMILRISEHGAGNPPFYPDLALRFADANGADVILSDFGDAIYGNIARAISYARNCGRDGKGCVIVGDGDTDRCIYATYCGPFGDSYEPTPEPTPDGFIDVTAPAPLGHPVMGHAYTGAGLDSQGVGQGTNYGYFGYVPPPDEYDDGDYTYYMGYQYSQGTALVAGLAALLLSQHPDFTAAEVQTIIQASTREMYAPGWNQRWGWGLINAKNAVERADQPLYRYVLSADDEHFDDPVPIFCIDEYGFMYFVGALHQQMGNNMPTPNPNKYEHIFAEGERMTATPTGPTPTAPTPTPTGPTPTPTRPVALLVKRSTPVPPTPPYEYDMYDLYIRGKLYEFGTPIPTDTPTSTPTGSTPTPGGPTQTPVYDKFVVKNPQNTPVGIIDRHGNLYLKGQCYEDSRP